MLALAYMHESSTTTYLRASAISHSIESLMKYEQKGCKTILKKYATL